VEFSLKLITPDIILGTVRDISHRKRTDLAVQHAHEVLEERVNARTSELSAANAALQKEMTERQQAEQALRQAYQRLRMLLENSPLIVVEWDHRFRVTYWSEEAERFFGWPFEELRGKHPNQWQFVHEEDRPAVDGVINRLVDGSHQRYVGLNRNYRKDGSIVHCEWYNSAIYDETGQLISVLSLVLDVTLQRQASRALKESEKQYRRLVELCFDAVLTVSNDRILSINPAGSRFFGVDGPEDLIGHASAEFIQAESLARMAAHFQAAFEKQGELSLLEERIQRLDGTTIDVELASIQIVHQGQPAFQVVARDITARKQPQQALKASEAKFRSLTETTSAAIFIYQGDFNRYVNPMASTITG
jgi:PAS domain S-box-containing protein